jgi:ubiquinone/menaquinone biosynthesis C-methylase UbiE
MSDHSSSNDSSVKPVVERYSQSNNPGFEAIMALRTAEQEGKFFLQYLRPDMRVLDVGCGPGSITLGFANAVETSEAVGVDLQQPQIDQARALAAKKGVTNVQFETADVYSLPFSNDAFDAIFANAVLWHLREPLKALAEIRRVLKPGGIIGVRDCDWGGRIYAPATSRLDEWFELTVQIRRRNGGDPFLGRKLRSLLREAGFTISKTSVSSWTAGTLDEVQLFATFLKAQLQGFAKTAQEAGWMTQAEINSVSAEIDAWSSSPDAFYLDTYCEAIGHMVN